jgi:DNA helicase-2/ATP-dependent DNA helicase PcrA
VEELLDVLDEIQERAKPFQSIQEWLDYIREYTEGLRKREASTQMNEKAVQLMTMHGAKGLEFDTVFIVGANETIMPYKKAEIKDEIEEERRLFYVAMTRAKRKLVISYYKERNGKKLDASRFVGELMKTNN